MPSMFPFSAQSKTMAIAVTNVASTSSALPGVAGDSVRIVNEGPNHAYVSIGTGAQTATVPGTTPGTAAATSTPILAGTDVVFGIPSSAIQNISAICAGAGTAVLDVQVGEGM